MKKNLLLALCTASAIAALSTGVCAEEGMFIYESNGDGTCTITDFIEGSSVSEIELTATNSKGEEITEIDDYVLYKCEIETLKLTGLTAELGSTVLGYAKCTNLIIEDCNLVVDSSFASNMEDLTSLTISNSTIEFDDYAFYKLGDGAEVTISDSTLEFGSCAFGYGDIVSLTITSSEIEDSGSFFSNTEDITSIAISDTALDLDDYAFFKTGDKAAVSLSNCTGSFGSCAFEYAESESLQIDNCSFEFDTSAFSNNEKLISLKIGNGSYDFGEYAFFKCDKLTEAVIGGDSDDNLFIFDDCSGKYCDDLTAIEFGHGAFEVGSSFFSSCDSLENITFAETATLAGDDYLFHGAADTARVVYQGHEYRASAFEDIVS